MALMSQPEGERSLRRFLEKLPVEADEVRGVLGDTFPSMAKSSSALEKWWGLQMVSLAEPGVMELMSGAESAQRLQQIFSFMPTMNGWAEVEEKVEPIEAGGAVENETVSAEETEIVEAKKKSLPKKFIGIFNPAKLLSRKVERKPAEVIGEKVGELSLLKKLMKAGVKKRQLRAASDQLRSLQPRIHPLYRSLLSNYSHWLVSLESEDERAVDHIKKWLQMQVAQERVANELGKAAAFLDYEQSRRAQRAGANRVPRYHQRSEEDGGLLPTKRADVISGYLDALELEYQ